MPRLILVNRYFEPDTSATAQLLTDLAHALAPHCETIVLCSRQLLEDAAAQLAPRDQIGQVRVHRLWSSRRGRGSLPGRALDYLTFLASVGLWLLLHLRRGDVVLAKTDPPLLGVAAAVAALGREVSLVHWLQDLYPETAWGLGLGRPGSPAGRLLRGLRDWSLRRARLTVAVSGGMARQVRPNVRHGEIIPNWADDLSVAPARSYRAELGLQHRFVVGYSGNLGRAHPVATLQSLAEALRDDAGCHFLFTGSGAHLEMLRRHVEQCRAVNWSFLPYQPRARLAELIATADLHLVLLDPRLENLVFPSKVYGVLSAGRPLLHIGDAHGELAALIREHGCGWSMAEGDLAGLLELLARLRRQPAQLHQAGRQARLAYEKHFSKAAALQRWRSTLMPLMR